MSKRNVIILIILALAAFGSGAYWYFSQKGPAGTLGELFPGGSGTIGTPQGGETPTGGEIITPPEAGATPPRLYQLHNTPVAGVGFIEIKDKKGVITNLSARYLERGLGHIFETQLSTYTESRIVNETRTRISEALWGNGGKSVIVRFVDDKDGSVIKTRIVNIISPTDSAPNGFLKTEELYLPDSIPFMALAEDGADKLFYLTGEAGTTATFKDTNVTQIFNSTFTEWLPQFPSQKLITLTSRPSAKVPGHMFFLDPATKAVTKVLGNINGLTTLTSHDGKFVITSETTSTGPSLSVYDTTKKESRSLYLLSLAEKCAWSIKKTTLAYCAVPEVLPRATYPDQWYQGLVSFSDALWEIDATTAGTRKILSPRSLGAPSLDMTNLSLASDDSSLLFVDKTTGTPWVYSIVEPPLIQKPTVTTPSVSTSTPLVAPSGASSASTPTNAAVPPSVVTPGMQKLK